MKQTKEFKPTEYSADIIQFEGMDVVKRSDYLNAISYIEKIEQQNEKQKHLINELQLGMNYAKEAIERIEELKQQNEDLKEALEKISDKLNDPNEYIDDKTHFINTIIEKALSGKESRKEESMDKQEAPEIIWLRNEILCKRSVSNLVGRFESKEYIPADIVESRIKELEEGNTELKRKIEDFELDKARHQFIGFIESRSGDISSLVNCMGLTCDEWELLKEEEVYGLTYDDIRDIDYLFEQDAIKQIKK